MTDPHPAPLDDTTTDTTGDGTGIGNGETMRLGVTYTAADCPVDPTAESELEGEIRSGKLAGISLPMAIAIIAIPVLLEQLANATVGLVDQMITGRLPDAIARAALDGVGIGVYFSWFVNIAMAGIGVGGAALIARGVGSGDEKLAREALGQSLLFGIVWGILVGATIWLVAPFVAQFAGLTLESSGYFLDYVRTLALGLPVTGLMLIAAMCMHGAGETTRPFFIVLIANVVNIVVSWALAGVDITVFGTTFADPLGLDLHVFGVALGTVVARGVGTVLMIALLLRGIKGLKLDWPAMAPHTTMFRRIAKISVPGFADGIGLWFGNICVLYIIGLIATAKGTDGLQGAHAIAIRWESFSFLPGFAMGTAAGALGGQFLGARNPARAKTAIWACTLVGGGLMSLTGLGFIFFGETLTRIVSDDPIHLAYTPRLLEICGLVQFPFGLAMCLRGGLRGVGDTRSAMLMTWGTTYGIRLPLVYLFGLEWGLGLVGVWYALAAELILRGAIFLAHFLRGKWMHVKV